MLTDDQYSRHLPFLSDWWKAANSQTKPLRICEYEGSLVSLNFFQCIATFIRVHLCLDVLIKLYIILLGL